MNVSSLIKFLGVALLGAAASASAQNVNASFNFDSLVSGAYANDLATPAVSFHQAYFVPSLDGDGIAIPGSEHFEVDAANNALFPVTAEDPLGYGYGAAPSGTNALQALWQPVIIKFDRAYDVVNFSTTLDLSTYGNLGTSQISFVSDTATLATIDFDMTQPGLVLSNLGVIENVTGIVLAGGAFYDNINLTLVPEPATTSLAAALACFSFVAYRRRKTAV